MIYKSYFTSAIASHYLPAAVQGEKHGIMHFVFLQLKFELILQHYYVLE